MRASITTPSVSTTKYYFFLSAIWSAAPNGNLRSLFTLWWVGGKKSYFVNHEDTKTQRFIYYTTAKDLSFSQVSNIRSVGIGVIHFLTQRNAELTQRNAEFFK
ncbi:hypothetical protein CEN45_04585 [Fischerella thermalis CCMEE 5198]|jgi:hypothetical protein|nr:hypothetical protein CI594_05685 [Fischerella thermalis CCMEE 5196]PMB26068.1 hypothetical protein CEN45_04585 [Fischerella thermalis CCMEE 5198]